MRLLGRLLWAVLLAGLLPGAAALRAGEAPARTGLGGVPASVVLPAGWTTREEAPASGQWRLVLVPPAGHAGRVLAEARVFPVEEDEAPAQVLMQAAGLVARQAGAFGFGTPRLESRVVLGRPLADADLDLRAGGERLAGRMVLLRAGPALWALAWGLCSDAVPAALRESLRAFAGSLEPDEPAFAEPYAGLPDPEQVLGGPPGEEPVRRRHVEATVACLEAAVRAALPRLLREEVHAALADDVVRGGPRARAGYRDVARVVHEAQGQPAAEREELARQVGARVLEALQVRARETYPPAVRVAMVLSAVPKEGPGERGLPLLHAEHLLESASLLAALAADAWPAPETAARRTLRERAAARWATLDGPAREAWREALDAAPGLPSRWAAAPQAARLSLRAEAARLLRGLPPEQAPADARSLRGLLDAQPLGALPALEAALAAEPAALAAALRRLPAASPAK